jgi:oligopeptide transport system ATP-binding protein
VSLLELDQIKVSYRQRGKRIHAVRGLSLTIESGETVALVGESGCGKSTTGRVVAGLQRPTQGSVRLGEHAGTGVQMVFQHPDQSLDPMWPVERSVAEPLVRAGIGDRASRRAAVLAALRRVGLGEDYVRRKPRELSGGQAQRVAVARALIAEPSVVVLDEPTASLDQSVRSRLLVMLRQIQQDSGLGYLFISHDMASVRRLADRIVVMYLGQVVEEGDTETVFSRPTHPYTRALLAAIPPPDPHQEWSMTVLAGETPSATEIPAGCPFAARCPEVVPDCRAESPELRTVGAAHRVSCLLAESETRG